MRARLTPLLEKFSRPVRTGLDFVASNEAFAKLPLDDRTAVAAYVNELFDRFENLRLTYLRTSTAENYEWAHQIAYSLRASSNLVACYEAKDRPHSTWNTRDAEMAANVEWMRRRGSAEGGIVVLAHNGHVQRAVTTAVDPTMANLGSYLRDRFADGYRALGFTFGAGTMPTETGLVKQLPPSDPQSLDGALERIGVPLCLIDLSGLPPSARGAQWLGTPRKQRIQDFYAPYPELESWNGLFYIERVNASNAAAR
jgi:erythromycin esterase